MSETVFVKVTSALVVGGKIAKKGEIIEISHSIARDFLSRGKAVPATVADAPKAVEPAPAPAPEPVAETSEEAQDPEPLSTENVGLEQPANTGRRKKK